MTIKQVTNLLAILALVIAIVMAVLVSNNVKLLRGVLHENETVLLPTIQQGYEARINTIQVQQWLTDISATRGQDGLNDGFDEAKIAHDKFQENIKQLLKLNPANKELYLSILPIFETYYREGQKMAQAYIENGPQGGNPKMKAFDDAAAAINDKVSEIEQIIVKLGSKDIALANTTIHHHPDYKFCSP